MSTSSPEPRPPGPAQDPRAAERARDEQLVARALGGDGSAFEELYARHRPAVFKVAYGMTRNAEDALDIVQETFLKAHRSLARWERRAAVGTWLCQIAVHLAIDLARRRKVRQADPLDERLVDGDSAGGSGIKPPEGAQSPAAQASGRELEEALHQALGKLTEKHRTVFVLFAVRHLSYREIADTLGISIGTVMSRLFYARKNLQGLLAQFAHS